MIRCTRSNVAAGKRYIARLVGRVRPSSSLLGLSFEVAPADVLKAGSERWWDLISADFKGTHVFVNWVVPTVHHGNDVIEASCRLANRGFQPIPHVPISIFENRAEFEAFMARLKSARIQSTLIVSGNSK